MRVCCYCEKWESGGIESFLCNVLSRMDLTKCDVDIVAAHIGKSLFTKKLEEIGVHFFELSGQEENVIKNCCIFRRFLRRRKYDVLYLNAFNGYSLVYLHIARDEGVPVRIAHSHNTDLRKCATRPIKMAVHTWAKNKWTKDATELWACSNAAAEFLFRKEELQRRGFQFVPNGVDTKVFRFRPEIRARVRSELGLSNNFVIGHIGRICYQKNQCFLLYVLNEILRIRPESRLLLVGKGDGEIGLEHKAKDLGVADKTILYGTSYHVEELLWAMDVFAFPSVFEGFGMALVEAQAAGLPVVCSENIPKEALISPSITRVSLKDGVSKWTTAILRTMPVSDRKAANVVVENAGFDITHVAALVMNMWKECCLRK